MPLAQRVVDTIDRHALLRGGSRVLVALSGGADSVALLLLAGELQQRGVLSVAGVAHLNHQLRGADADADESFCAALAARLGISFIAERADVSALARTQKRSIEDAGRVARHAFFARALATTGADVVAVAHTVDDQAETFLLRLLRGAGTRGLAAIHPRAGRVIRPLLDIERRELREYLAAAGEPFREDASNADVAFARNRVRHELIPFLEARFSSSVTRVLAREAALARHDEEFLAAEAIKLAARIVLPDTDVRIDVAGLISAPRALSSRVAQVALQRLAGRKSIHFDHVDRLLALGEGPPGARRAVSLPGQDAVRVGGSIVLRPAPRRRANRGSGRDERGPAVAPPGSGSNDGPVYAVALSIPGEVELEAQHLAVAAEHLPPPGTAAADSRLNDGTGWSARGMEVGIAAGAVQLPLAVRNRRPGDRFHPLGAPGRRKLQDFLIDRKVAREQRDSVPLVVDGRDRIVWVVGQSVAEDFRVIDPSLGVILLKVRHLGGLG